MSICNGMITNMDYYPFTDEREYLAAKENELEKIDEQLEFINSSIEDLSNDKVNLLNRKTYLIEELRK